MAPLFSDHRPVIVDLFAGVGGLSLGAARAGFNVVAAVENDPQALEIHTLNSRLERFQIKPISDWFCVK